MPVAGSRPRAWTVDAANGDYRLLATSAADGSWGARLLEYRAALGLWRGPALVGGNDIDTRQAAFTARTGTPMTPGNVWLEGRQREAAVVAEAVQDAAARRHRRRPLWPAGELAEF